MMTSYDRGGSSCVPTSTWHDSAAQTHGYAYERSHAAGGEDGDVTKPCTTATCTFAAGSGSAECELRTWLRQLEVRNRDRRRRGGRSENNIQSLRGTPGDTRSFTVISHTLINEEL